nr:glycosylphosphatidylinositol-anchored lipid protein transfer 1 [Tanacetum cinerariifolium]
MPSSPTTALPTGSHAHKHDTYGIVASILIPLVLSLAGFAAALAILIIGASQSRQHGMSEPKFLKSLTVMAYSLSSLPEVEHSSSLDSFLAFKAREGSTQNSITWALRLRFEP